MPVRFRFKQEQLSIERLVRLEAKPEKKIKLKRDFKAAFSEHTRVYGEYLAAVDYMEGDPLPLKTHQLALRACTPPPAVIRPHMARLFQQKKLSQHELAHPYESRFQKIMQNIMDAGFDPTIEDYHFIMSQFAAVGDYAGIQTYMNHMDKMGLEPKGQTYGFILQAIAHRISLLPSDSQQPITVRKLVDIFILTLREMADRRIPPSSIDLDLAVRVLSEVHDLQGLTELLRVSYGVDLSYLDSPPIDAASVPPTSTANSSPGVPPVLPFSTYTLNSLLKTLGRWGQISKMTYVFETLTNPLPVPAKSDNTFDDDDGDFFPIQQEWKPQSAEPNSTSFNILIKYCVAHKCRVLAKHYALELMKREHGSTIRLRNELRVRPLSEIATPHLAVNEETLRPLLALASRTRNIALLKWVIRACKLSARRKYRAWTYYNETKSKHDPGLAPSTSDTPAAPESSSSSSLAPTPLLRKTRRSSTFEIPTHLWILRRDIALFYSMKVRAKRRLFNIIDRIKARLGRRVWAGKSVYMRDKAARVNVDPEVWKKKVNFKKRREQMLRPTPGEGS